VGDGRRAARAGGAAFRGMRAETVEDRSTKRVVIEIDSPGSPSPRLQIRDDRYYVVHLFGDLRDSLAVPILVPLLKDRDVNSIVPWSLGEIGNKSAIPPLIETLGDNSPDMRVLPIYALEKLKARDALPQIRALLDDDETIHFDGLGTVAKAARAAIATLIEIPREALIGQITDKCRDRTRLQCSGPVRAARHEFCKQS
jgi:HEAT repeat protein